jgi:hypothetical protein
VDRLLKDKNAEVDLFNSKGYHILHIAAIAGDETILQVRFYWIYHSSGYNRRWYWLP